METAKPSVAISSLPPVDVGKKADLLAGVQIDVTSVRAVTLKAEGPGEVAGPGVRVEIAVTNDSSKAFNLGGLAVTASYAKGTPASANDGPPADPLAGRLAAGKSAVGVYFFRVPRAEVDSLVVEVSSDSSPSIVIFRN